MNNNVNLRFDMRKNDRENLMAQEDDEEKDVHQENLNRCLTECFESSSDENKNTHSKNVVGNGTSHSLREAPGI